VNKSLLDTDILSEVLKGVDPGIARKATAYLRAFGRTDFVESLGIPYPGVKKRLDWTEQKLLDEIRRWQAEGHRLNYKAVHCEYQALIHQARKFFGSWDRARAAVRVS
jgi:hypothetical protein